MSLKARNLAQFAALAVVAVALTACDIAVNGDGGLHFDVGASAKDEWKRSYKVAATGRLEIINVNGKITAEASDGDTIEILAERSAKAASDESAKDLLSKLEMREEASESRVRIEVRAPRWNGAGGHEIKWTIKVPKTLAVDLRTVNGGVVINNLSGEVRARSTNGGIKGEGLASANVDAAVTNGGVEIALSSAPANGSIDLEAVNGGVSLVLPGDSKADITARTVNGGISVNGLELEVVGEQTRRKVEGKLNGGGARVTLETTNGGVRISRATT